MTDLCTILLGEGGYRLQTPCDSEQCRRRAEQQSSLYVSYVVSDAALGHGMQTMASGQAFYSRKRLVAPREIQDDTDEYRNSLMWFARLNELDRMRQILDLYRLAVHDVASSDGSGALHAAIHHENIGAVEILVKDGARPFYENKHGGSAMRYAAHKILGNNGSLELRERLKGLLPWDEFVEECGFPKLHLHLFDHLSRNSFAELFKRKNKVELAEKSKSTTAKKTEVDIDEDIVDYTKEGRIEINAKDKLGYTALHWAAMRGDDEAVDILIANGADVNARTKAGGTPLMPAARRKETITPLQLLLLAHSDPNAQNNDSVTPLHSACRQGTWKHVRLLLAAGANIEACSDMGITPLARACRNNNAEIVGYLLKKDAKYEARDVSGATPLFQAVAHQASAALRTLLGHTHGLNLGSVDNDQQTILHVAAKWTNVECCRLLRDVVQSRSPTIDAHAKDWNGKTALQALEERRDMPQGFVQEFKTLLEATEAAGTRSTATRAATEEVPFIPGSWPSD